MLESLFRNAPMLLAVLDENLRCRHLSRGWRARLGLSDTSDAQGLSMPDLFLSGETVSLEGKLRESLHEDGSLQDVPVSLLGANVITQGLLSAWPILLESGSAGLCLAATCNTDLERTLDELRHLRTMHELILNAAGEGI